MLALIEAELFACERELNFILEGKFDTRFDQMKFYIRIIEKHASAIDALTQNLEISSEIKTLLLDIDLSRVRLDELQDELNSTSVQFDTIFNQIKSYLHSIENRASAINKMAQNLEISENITTLHFGINMLRTTLGELQAELNG